MHPYRITGILLIALFLICVYVGRSNDHRMERIARDLALYEELYPGILENNTVSDETRHEYRRAERFAFTFLPPLGLVEIGVYFLLIAGAFFIHLSRKYPPHNHPKPEPPPNTPGSD